MLNGGTSILGGPGFLCSVQLHSGVAFLHNQLLFQASRYVYFASGTLVATWGHIMLDSGSCCVQLLPKISI